MSHHAGATALVGADAWDAPAPTFEVAWRVPIAPTAYEPGLRSLQQVILANQRHIADEEPYLCSVLAALDPTAIVFRGYAIATANSFGMRLFEATKVPVIGIAQAFDALHAAEEVWSGYYVTALGMPIPDAATRVRTMALAERLPVLVARARALVHGAASAIPAPS